MNRSQLLPAALGIALLVLMGLSIPSPPAPAGSQPAPVVAIVDARVFDGEAVLPRATVLLRDGRIEAVGADLAVPEHADVIEGQGRTLLPGLIDAHVHSWGGARADALRFGVTTVLDMFTDPRQLPAARAEREAGTQAAQADLWSAGWLATAEGGHGSQFGLPVPPVRSAGEAEAWVAARRAEGSDFIKIVREDLHVYSAQQRMPTLDAAAAAALIAAAQAQGLRAVVHATAQAAARESLQAGADGLVHVFQDAEADAEFVRLAATRDAFVIPTLSVIARFAGEASSLAEDSRLAPWLSPEQQAALSAGHRFGEGGARLLRNAEASVRALHAAGVRILAGTDAPNPGTAHGVSLHEEMARLAALGLGNQGALVAATSAPADAFGLADRGRIRAGLRADLVLVEGDPLADIEATRAIVGIWKNGRVVAREPAGIR